MDSIAHYLLIDLDNQNKTSAHRLRQIRDKSNIFNLSNREFINLFRLTKPAVKYLLEELNDKLVHSGRSTSIPNILKLAALLRFCAQGSYQKSVGQDFLVGMSQPKMSVVLTELFAVMEEHLCPKWISFRQSEEDKEQAIRAFFSKTGFPGVIGCVDGTHINIIRPTENENQYFNRKGNHSLNTMIDCDHKMRILSIDSRYGGAAHDSMVWSLSKYRTYLQRNSNEHHNYWLLGDSGYPLEPWLLTPFRAPVDGSREAKFNTCHSKTRNVVERAIGLLKGRFRCLLGARELHYSAKKASQIINVCSGLHNICSHFNVAYLEATEQLEVVEQYDIEIAPGLETENTIAQQIRLNILYSIT